MLKGVLVFLILAVVASNFVALADDEKPASAASIPELKSGRNRRKLPTSMIISVL